MKLYRLALVLFPFSTLITDKKSMAFHSPYAVTDTLKKLPTTAELKK